MGKNINRKIRVAMPEQNPEIRKNNFLEVPTGYNKTLALKEAKRCIQCKKPECIKGCPVSVNIPEFIKYISEEKFYEAAQSLWIQNALPAVCGRVCPQEIQCEGKCIVGKKNDPIAIGNLERFIADWAIIYNIENSTKIKYHTNKKIAVIGSGPSSLTVAGDLLKQGHKVTMLEAFHKPGGVLIYGIPEFRLPKKIVSHEVNSLKKLGLDIKLNNVVGKNVTLKELFNNGYNAIFLGLGAGLPRFLNIPGENLIGILSANEYLTRANLMEAYKFPKVDTPIPIGTKVVVLGGGNVAMDSARTALRLGAEKVTIVYRRSRNEMPARNAEIHHAEEEGIKFSFLTNPINFIGNNNGQLTGMKCIKMELGKPDNSGRFKPIPINNSEFDIETDLVIISVGSGASPILTETTPALDLNKWGYIKTDSYGKTSMKGVWAGGDIVTGAATVILAMGAGRKSAESMNNYLTLGW